MKHNLPIYQVTHLIPQKTPFVLVDTLLKCDKQSILSSFFINPNHILCSNGFLTEEGVIENMAQTVALHTGFHSFINGEIPPTGYIGAIKKTTLFALPKTESTLQTKAEILFEFDGVTLVKTICSCEGKPIAEAEMKTVVV